MLGSTVTNILAAATVVAGVGMYIDQSRNGVQPAGSLDISHVRTAYEAGVLHNGNLPRPVIIIGPNVRLPMVPESDVGSLASLQSEAAPSEMDAQTCEAVPGASELNHYISC